jgi:hypothetical protein
LSYSHFLFWDETLIDPMNSIYNSVESFYSKSTSKNVTIIRENDRIEILFPVYKFIFTLNKEDWVQEESKDIAETFGKNRTDYNRISNSQKRIEFYGEEDFNMDYFNDYLLILENIQREMHVTIFDTDNGKFF